MINLIGDGQQAKLVKPLLPYVCSNNLYHIAVGSPAARKHIVETELPSTAVLFNVGKLAHFTGDNVFVSHSNTQIGYCVYLNTGCIVEHDCTIGDYVNINPGAILCGAVTVGECTTIGAGAVVKEGVTIGKDVVIGAGAVVLKDVPNGETWVGNPARKITITVKTKKEK